MYFKHVNLIIITHVCAAFSGAIININSCTYLYYLITLECAYCFRRCWNWNTNNTSQVVPI